MSVPTIAACAGMSGADIPVMLPINVAAMGLPYLRSIFIAVYTLVIYSNVRP
jgi:hypothetical protein